MHDELPSLDRQDVEEFKAKLHVEDLANVKVTDLKLANGKVIYAKVLKTHFGEVIEI